VSGKGLPIIEERVLSKKEQFEEETRARCEKAWVEKGVEKGTPTILERERIKRTAEILSKLSLNGKAVADLGCGSSPFSLEGAHVTAVDAADSMPVPDQVKRIKGCLPYVRLPEESFDGVLLTDVIAEIEPHLYRLLLSEISTLMKRDSFFLCSTELDLGSEDPYSHFLSLLRTEFQVLETKKSYHRLYIYLRHTLDAPTRFVRAGKEEAYRLQQIQKRRGLSRLWFYLNSLKWVSAIWSPLTPLKKQLHHRPLLLLLERISEALWGEGALTHVIVLCKRKSLHQHQ